MSKRYTMTWRNKWLTAKAESLDDMIASLTEAAAELEAMKKAGVVLEDDGSVGDDYAMLVTEDPEVAKRFDFEEEQDEDMEDEGDEE